MPINVSLRSALIIQGLWGTERGRLARRSSVGAVALFAMRDEEAICLRSVHSSYRRFVFFYRRNLICIHFLESEMNTRRSWLEQKEQTVLTACIPPSSSHYRSYMSNLWWAFKFPMEECFNFCLYVHASNIPATSAGSFSDIVGSDDRSKTLGSSFTAFTMNFSHGSSLFSQLLKPLSTMTSWYDDTAIITALVMRGKRLTCFVKSK